MIKLKTTVSSGVSLVYDNNLGLTYSLVVYTAGQNNPFNYVMSTLMAYINASH